MRNTSTSERARTRVRWRGPSGEQRARMFNDPAKARQFAAATPGAQLDTTRRRPRPRHAAPAAAPASDFLKGLMNPWQM